MELYRLQGLAACIIVMIWPPEVGFEEIVSESRMNCGERCCHQTFLCPLVVFFMMHRGPRNSRLNHGASMSNRFEFKTHVLVVPDGILARHKLPGKKLNPYPPRTTSLGVTDMEKPKRGARFE